jgi:hypothetical protein
MCTVPCTDAQNTQRNFLKVNQMKSSSVILLGDAGGTRFPIHFPPNEQISSLHYLWDSILGTGYDFMNVNRRRSVK